MSFHSTRRDIAAFATVAALLAATSAAAQAPPTAAQKAPKAPAAVAAPKAPAGPLGVWIDHTGRGAVEISRCGDAGPAAQSLCGRIVWLKDPNDEKGRPLRDILNKDTARRGKPICGLQIIGDVRLQGPGLWDQGWIYDPEKGSSFDLEVRLRGPETLQIKGYLGVKFLSETYVWQRANGNQPRCAGV